MKDRRITIVVMIVVLAVAAGVAAIVVPDMINRPAASEYVARYADIPTSRQADGGFVLGEPDAPVTIVEFADFFCTHCQDYHEVIGQFVETYVATGQAKFEYRLFPLAERSIYPAQLAECAEQQQEGMFWPAYDFLFDLAERGQLSVEFTSRMMADTLGLDAAALDTCAPTASQYQTDQALGDQSGVNGTPAVLVRMDEDTLGWAYVGGRAYSQGGTPLSILQQVIEAEDLSSVVLVPEPLIDNLVDDEPCAAPCWRGITPGETPWDEATALIGADRNFLNAQEQTSATVRALLWTTLDEYDCCQMITESGTRVDELFLISPATTDLGEVVAFRGEPTYAVSRDTGQGSLLVYLYYPETGVILYVFTEGTGADSLNETSQVAGVSYMSAERMNSLIEEIQPVAWTGYADVLTYEIVVTEAAPATDEAVATDEVAATDEAPATDEPAVTEETPATDEPQATDEATAQP